MADRRIDQLTESAEIADDDLFVIWKQDISQTCSIQTQNVFNVGIQSIIDRITQWTDITTDFSITGSTPYTALDYVKYNSALKQLKVKCIRSNATSRMLLNLTYNGENSNITFTKDLVFYGTHIGANDSRTPSGGFGGVIINDRNLQLNFAEIATESLPSGSIFTFMIQL